jgi:collagen beta-1,O-galactosyltransferase
MKAFVLNLKRRADRLAHMHRVLPPELDVVFTTDWPIPTDGQTLTPGALDGFGLFPWSIESQQRFWRRPLKKGEIGCAIGHWSCWRHSLVFDDDLFAYFEDDICFADDFVVRLGDGLTRLSAFDSEWDLLYLGRYKAGADTPILDGIVKPGFSYSAFAYVLTRRAVAKILATNFSAAIIPVDELLPALYLEHPRSDVRQRYPPVLRAYAFVPPLVTTLASAIGGSDTEDSDFIEVCCA